MEKNGKDFYSDMTISLGQTDELMGERCERSPGNYIITRAGHRDESGTTDSNREHGAAPRRPGRQHPEGASPERQRTPDLQMRGDAALIVSRAPLKGTEEERSTEVP